MIPALSITFRYPRLTILALLLVAVGGVAAILTLDRQEDPILLERYGLIVVSLPGASAERMEALVTTPIESALFTISEVTEIGSVSRAGTTQLTFEFDESLTSAEVESTWNELNQRVALARSSFPDGTSEPVIDRLYTGAAALVTTLTWTGGGEPPLSIMQRYTLDLENELQRIVGTQRTQIYGAPEEQVSVFLNSEILAAVGLTVEQAANAVRSTDAKMPAGRIRTSAQNIELEINGAFDSLDSIRNAPIKVEQDSTSLRVRDVAVVKKTYNRPASKRAYADQHRAIFLAAFISPDRRVDHWSQDARRILSAFSDQLPTGIALDVVFDQSTYTEQRLSDLAHNLALSVIIIFGLLFLLMGWRSALIVGISIPTTLLLVLVLFKIFDYPLHQISVTGIILALGLLIDNAIVVVDEFDHTRNQNVSKLVAIETVVSKLAAPLGASTATTALAFAPIALLPGTAGEFMGMIGVSVILSITCSYLMAMTIIPAASAWIDRTRFPSPNGSLSRPRHFQSGLSIPFLVEGYRQSLGLILRRPWIGVALGVLPAATGLYLAAQLPTQFFPPVERDQFQITLTLPPQSTSSVAESLTSEVTELIRSYEGVESVYWILGEPSPRVYYNSFNLDSGFEGVANGWVQLNGSASARKMAPIIQDKIRVEFPTAMILAQPFEQGPPVDAPIVLNFYGPDTETLAALGDHARSIMSETPGVLYTKNSLQPGAPSIEIQADETAVGLTGLSLIELATVINSELEGTAAGSLVEGTEELPVVVYSTQEKRSSLTELRSLPIGNSPGGIGTPLSAFGEAKLIPKTAVITRLDGQRVNQVLGYLEPFALPSVAQTHFDKALEEAPFSIPVGYSMKAGGEAESARDATTDLLGVGLPLVLVIAGSIVLVFNSFRKMAVILIGGFLTIGPGLFCVWLFQLPLGFIVILGALALVGISINGSIVILSLLDSKEANAKGSLTRQREIVVKASRHILATTITTIGGLLPILLSGDVFWLPLAVTISGGVIGSTVIALYFTPAIFSMMSTQSSTQ